MATYWGSSDYNHRGKGGGGMGDSEEVLGENIPIPLTLLADSEGIEGNTGHDTAKANPGQRLSDLPTVIDSVEPGQGKESKTPQAQYCHHYFQKFFKHVPSPGSAQIILAPRIGNF